MEEYKLYTSSDPLSEIPKGPIKWGDPFETPKTPDSIDATLKTISEDDKKLEFNGLTVYERLEQVAEKYAKRAEEARYYEGPRGGLEQKWERMEILTRMIIGTSQDGEGIFCLQVGDIKKQFRERGIEIGLSQSTLEAYVRVIKNDAKAKIRLIKGYQPKPF
jgi:hypothetical protein